MPSLFRKHNPTKPPPVKKHRTKADNRQAGRLNTNSAQWKAIRAKVLASEPLCRECAKAGRVTAALHVDHIDGDSWNNEPDNLQPLCIPCHGRKTVREDGGFGNERKHR